MQYIGPSFVSEGVIYAAYRPNCYAIYNILSTNDGILNVVCHFVFYAHAHYS